MKAQLIEECIVDHLNLLLPHHPVSEVYHYACLPGGKFFRPSLVWSILKDLNPALYSQSVVSKRSAHAFLASSVELHHSYTLIHDDLPSMDNDTTRRGKPCTHLAFGEWRALLAGDGLLNLSFQLIGKIRHTRISDVISFYSWATGPKGLIQGQVLDLSHEMTKSFKNTLKTHELKTARLIQVAILTSAALSSEKKNSVLEKDLYRFSKLLGVNFQLIDDLSELAEVTLSEHELDVNPWLKFTNEAFEELIRGLDQFQAIAKKYQLKATNEIVREYYLKMNSLIEPNLTIINQHLKNQIDLRPVIFKLNSFN